MGQAIGGQQPLLPGGSQDQAPGRPKLRQTGLRMLFAAGLPLLAGAGIWLLVKAGPAAGGTLLPCLFHQWTGLFCIGCGTTRALAALLQGRLPAALSYNAFAVIWLAWPAWSGLGIWLQVITGRRVIPQPKDRRALLLALLLSALLFVGLRNLPFLPFSWLAP